jgi:hypothetical protein
MFLSAWQGETMTTRCRARPTAAAFRGLCAVPLALLLAGCTTAAIEDVGPVASTPAAAEAEQPSFARPGDYPNLNVVPTPAAAQFTEEEKTARVDELRSRRDRLVGQAASQGVRDRSAELRQLGRSHADDTLRAIEAE